MKLQQYGLRILRIITQNTSFEKQSFEYTHYHYRQLFNLYSKTNFKVLGSNPTGVRDYTSYYRLSCHLLFLF